MRLYYWARKKKRSIATQPDPTVSVMHWAPCKELLETGIVRCLTSLPLYKRGGKVCVVSVQCRIRVKPKHECNSFKKQSLKQRSRFVLLVVIWLECVRWTTYSGVVNDFYHWARKESKVLDNELRWCSGQIEWASPRDVTVFTRADPGTL